MSQTGVLSIAQAVLEYPGSTAEIIREGYKSGSIKGSKRGRIIFVERASLERFLIGEAAPSKTMPIRTKGAPRVASNR